MTKVYSAPKTIERPKLDIHKYDGFEEYERQQQKYIERVRQFVKKRKPRGQLVGEIIRFGVADGYAQYMVASLRPLELIHLDLGDGYHFQYVERITAQDVRELVEREKSLAELFHGSRSDVPAP